MRCTVGIAFNLGYVVLRFNSQLLAVLDHLLIIHLLIFLQVSTKCLLYARHHTRLYATRVNSLHLSKFLTCEILKLLKSVGKGVL